MPKLSVRRVASLAAPFLLLGAALAPLSAALADSGTICEKLDNDAKVLWDGWILARDRIVADEYDNKLERLRNSYDVIRDKLTWKRDEAAQAGCTALANDISTALREWERP